MSLVGQPAPKFTLPSTKNLAKLDEPVSLDDYAGQWLVLFFYPADFTFVCPTEIIAFNERASQFAAHGASLLAVSTDSVYSHQAWLEFALGKISYPLASDPNLVITRAYGVLTESTGEAQRALFIIDPEGFIRYEVIHDIETGRNVEEVFRVLLALSSKGLCAANWRRGDPNLVV